MGASVCLLLRRDHVEIGFGFVEKEQKPDQVDTAAAGFEIIRKNGFLEIGRAHV